MRGLFLVGTDTGVGKTTVAIGLLRLASRRGVRLFPYKPVETGCDPTPHDAVLLRDAANVRDLTLSDVCPFPLPSPVAPSVAAHLAGLSLSAKTIVSRARKLADRADALLVEGAGGLLTPYGPDLTAASLIDLLDIDVLLIAANRIGTINHTALSVAEIRRRQLRLVGIVLVDVAREPEPSRAFNSREIRTLTGIAPLGTLRHCRTTDTDTIADTLAKDVALDGLLDGVFS